ncbi:MAG: TonB-dependent receptor [Bacteroidetes bacterium]|nr:MAG: TonB-dependent receptor [Bacteroidota bacterium]
MKPLLLSALFSLLSLGGLAPLSAQKAVVEGYVLNDANDEPLIAATIKAGDSGTISELDGSFRLELKPGKVRLVFRYVGFEEQVLELELQPGERREVEVRLKEEPALIKTVTVTSGKYEKPLGEVTVSLEVVRPNLLHSTNPVSLDGLLNKVPGLNFIGDQANIRGGSGFSYGAGSRVLLLVDDMPILQPDAGFPQWEDVPMESMAQVEVVKGAASALYGSSALNGIINVRTAYAKGEPETKIAPFATLYSAPKDEATAWWKQEGREGMPYQAGLYASHKQKFGRFDLVAGGHFLRRIGVNDSTRTTRGRININTRYRITDRLSVGVNSNFNKNKGSSFFFWKGIGKDIRTPSPTTVSNSENTRFNIDPNLTYFDPSGNRHRVLGRFYRVDNNTGTEEADQSNQSDSWYAEYQIQRKFSDAMVATAGFVYQGSAVQAPLYGDTLLKSRNLAGYAQFERKLGERLNLSAGFRYERNTILTPDTFFLQTTVNGILIDKTIVVENGEFQESKPVFRFGMNYKLNELTFLRASWGQGYRFPTIAEKFIFTLFGGVPISPNPDLRSETGWTGEVGLKKGFRFQGFQGFVDVVGFWSEYQDMMEFNLVNLFPTGFQSINVGDTRIKGYEISISGRGSLFGLTTDLLMGYTFIDPKFQEFDTTPLAPGETPTEGQRNALNSSVKYNVLKYRSKHSLKFDAESSFARWRIGLSAQYNSHIEAIDAIFENLIVPGLNTYRAQHDNGYLRIDVRSGYQLSSLMKVSLIVNNLLNKDISSRPGILDDTRNFTLRLDFDF